MHYALSADEFSHALDMVKESVVILNDDGQILWANKKTQTLFNFNLQKKTGVIYYSNKKIIRKFSTNTKNKTLINEYIGFNWYLEMYKSKIKNKIFKTEFIKKHNYINFPLIKAKKIYFWKWGGREKFI